MNSNNDKVSKALAMAGLLCLPGLLAPDDFESAMPAMLPGAVATDACGAMQEDPDFRMLQPGEQPQLRAAHGLQVCLAVYRAPGNATR